MTNLVWHDETVVGGIYETIQVEGNTIASSSIEANELVVEADGVLKIEDQLNVPYLTVKGELRIEGTLETNELIIEQNGYVAVLENVVLSTLNNKGTIDLKQGLRAQEIHNQGAFIGSGPVNTTVFHSEGSIRLDESLNAEETIISVAEASNIRYITSEHTTIKAEREKLIFKDRASRLTVREMDSKRADVENLVCDVLRADDVEIKKYCTIKVVEYVNDYQYDEASDVLEFAKISRN
ncbi:hypothetical protein [Macrococcoides caseolyticum]|uniref:hypothetical protein n=1 Tax=Macrococcoides caseolyticum TaxID=69966 RepID=UPI001F3DB5A5|nr:hypothetical protein [Macrococcus caseolyticus]MCE4957772.1 hypothetical protein [Macrococcus caseolyticus]